MFVQHKISVGGAIILKTFIEKFPEIILHIFKAKAAQIKIFAAQTFDFCYIWVTWRRL